jgi:hypothetical protein
MPMPKALCRRPKGLHEDAMRMRPLYRRLQCLHGIRNKRCWTCVWAILAARRPTDGRSRPTPSDTCGAEQRRMTPLTRTRARAARPKESPAPASPASEARTRNDAQRHARAAPPTRTHVGPAGRAHFAIFDTRRTDVASTAAPSRKCDTSPPWLQRAARNMLHSTQPGV